MSSKLSMIIIWIAVIALLVIGLIMVTSTVVWAGESVSSPYEPLIKQGVFGGVGLLVAIILSRIDYRLFRQYVWFFYIFACILLILCYTPLGVELNGERRWIRLGIQFQPSECAKICMMMILAHILALYRDKSKTLLKGFLIPMGFFGIPLALILFEKDMGTAAALAVAGFCVIYVAGARTIYVLLTVLGGFSCLAWLVQTNENRMERIAAWVDLYNHRLGAGLQQYRASVALSRGGFDGVGLGESTEKHGTLPFAHTDFIFAPLGEELGFLGTMGVILAFFFIAYCGLNVALHSKDPYGRYLAIGIVAMVFCPASLNIAVVLNALPNSGLPLPFISYGGTNLVFTLAALGVLTSIQRFSTNSQPNCEITRKDERAKDLRL